VIGRGKLKLPTSARGWRIILGGWGNVHAHEGMVTGCWWGKLVRRCTVLFLAFYTDVILVGVLHLELPKSDWSWDLIWDIILSG
jgi:hypothetical protein